MFQAEGEAKNSAGCLGYRGLPIATSLRAESVTPYGHFARTVRWDLG